MAKKELPKWSTTVTPFSKMLALSMLVIIPVLTFFYGMYYQRQLDQNRQPVEYILIPPKHATPTKTSTPPDGIITCRSNSDCPRDYSCSQAGPIRADGQPHKTCWKKGLAVPM